MSHFALIPMISRQTMDLSPDPIDVEGGGIGGAAVRAAIATCSRLRLPPERLGMLTLPNGDLAVAAVNAGAQVRVLAIARTDIASDDLDRAFAGLAAAQYFSAAPFPADANAGELQ